MADWQKWYVDPEWTRNNYGSLNSVLAVEAQRRLVQAAARRRQPAVAAC